CQLLRSFAEMIGEREATAPHCVPWGKAGVVGWQIAKGQTIPEDREPLPSGTPRNMPLANEADPVAPTRPDAGDRLVLLAVRVGVAHAPPRVAVVAVARLADPPALVRLLGDVHPLDLVPAQEGVPLVRGALVDVLLSRVEQALRMGHRCQMEASAWRPLHWDVDGHDLVESSRPVKPAPIGLDAGKQTIECDRALPLELPAHDGSHLEWLHAWTLRSHSFTSSPRDRM